MKNTKLLIIAIIVIPFLFSCGKKKETALYATVVEDDLNVRSSPRGKVIGRLSIGDKVVVLGRTKKKYKVGQWENYWYKIKMKDGQTGWCFSQWIAIGDAANVSNAMRAVKRKTEGYDFFLYASNFKDNSMGMYSIAGDGTLKYLGVIKSIKKPGSLEAHPEKAYLYLAERSRIITYRINKNGKPEAIGTINGAGYLYIHVHPSGRFVYATSTNPLINVSMYEIQRDGRLKSMGDIFTYKSPRKFAIHPSGTFAYFYDNHKINTIMSYRIKTTGKLEALDETIIGGKSEGAVVVHPTGKFLYAADVRAGALNVYSIDIGGKLKLTSSLPGIAFPGDIVFNDEGTLAYVSLPRMNRIIAFKVLDDGKFVKINEVETGTLSRDIELHPNGKTLYVLSSGSNNVYVFAVKPDGSLEKKAVIPAGLNPLSISIGRVKKPEAVNTQGN